MSNRKKTALQKAQEILAGAVPKFDGCLIWQGPVDEYGFGYTKFNGKKARVHRLVKFYHVERSEEQLANLAKLRLENTCGHLVCVEPSHWQFRTSKPEKVWESDEALRQVYASYL